MAIDQTGNQVMMSAINEHAVAGHVKRLRTFNLCNSVVSDQDRLVGHGCFRIHRDDGYVNKR
jgi:hypothetical protein